MKKKLAILTVIAGLILTGCESTKEYTYYFAKKQLKEKEIGNNSQEKIVNRPVKFPASQDIQITIKEYNPLRDEIIVEDSSSSRSVGDTGALARLIAFPTLPKTGSTLSQITSDSIVTTMTLMSTTAVNSYVASAKVVKNADCIAIKQYMYNLDQITTVIDGNTEDYKEFLSKVEIISDDYEYLKGLLILSGGDVSNRLRNSFLARLNNFLPGSLNVNADPDLTSSRDIAALETHYFKEITDMEKFIQDVETNVDNLTGKCDTDNFPQLLKKFLAAVTKTKESLKELKTNRTDKLLPALNKKLLMYDNMKKYIPGVPDYVTKAVNIDKDFHSLNIYKKENGTDSKKLYDHINIEPTKGFKVSVAGGIFFSGLTDMSYSKKTKDSIYAKKYLNNGLVRDTTVQQTFTSVYLKEQKKISYGGMLYIQGHTQNACYLNFGWYVGFGALFNDQTRWAGSTGLSIILGKAQRFGIHAGAIAAQVDRLTQPYDVNTWYAETIDNIPTYKAWDVTGMLGFSWSFK